MFDLRTSLGEADSNAMCSFCQIPAKPVFDLVIRGIFALAPPMPFLFGRFLFPAGDCLVR